MPAWIRAMVARPKEPWTPLARYTTVNGVLYVLLGLALYVGPWVGWNPQAEVDVGSGQLQGISIAVIGWFYIFGARTNRDSFGLATVADRLALPVLLLPLVLTGAVEWTRVLPLAIIDPILGVGAWWVWASTGRGESD